MTTTLPDFIDALVAALQDREALTGVNVFGCPVTPEDLGAEAIELAEQVSVTTARDSMDSQVETYDVKGSVLVLAPMGRGTDRVATINAAAKVARDRCAAILDEVLDELQTDDTMDDTVRDVEITSADWHQGMAPEGQQGRVCWVEFAMAVTGDVG